MDLPDSARKDKARRTRWSWRLIGLFAVATVVAVVATGLIVHNRSAQDAVAEGLDIAVAAGALAEQEIGWEACDFTGLESAPQPTVDTSNVQCATVKVPRDWHASEHEQTWDLRISRASNVTTPEDGRTLMVHPGGPYSGLGFAATIQDMTPQLRDETNYISFDQRGLGQSSSVTCEYSYDAAGGFAADAEASGRTCSADADFATMTTEQVAYDMEFVRHLLGVDRVSYLGYSYGSWVGVWFGNLFPSSVDRLVLDSVIDGSSSTYEKSYTAQSAAIDRQFTEHLLPWAARNGELLGLEGDADQIRNRYFAATTEPDAREAAYLLWTSTGAVTAFNKTAFFPVAGGVVAGLIADGEAGGGGSAQDRAIRIVESMPPTVLPDAAKAEVLAGLASDVPIQREGRITAALTSAQDFLRCVDGQWNQNEAYWADFNAQLSDEAPLSTQLRRHDNPPMCAYWQTDLKMPSIVPEFPQTLILQSELDALTPLEEGQDLAVALPRVSSVIVEDESNHGVFPYGVDAVDAIVLDFLSRGEAPPSRTLVPSKPLPLESEPPGSFSPGE